MVGPWTVHGDIHGQSMVGSMVSSWWDMAGPWWDMVGPWWDMAGPWWDMVVHGGCMVGPCAVDGGSMDGPR